MKALIVGLGSIGRRHLDNLRALVPDAEVTVWRRQGSEAPDPAIRVVRTLEEALAARPDFAIVASPASRHISDGLALAAAGVHLFMEKPIAHEVEGVAALIALCRQLGLTLMVGYHLRFSPAMGLLRDAVRSGRIGQILGVQAIVGQYLPDWRPGGDYRQGVSARADLGGGVLLELSHEFDYLRWVMGEVEGLCALAVKASALDTDVEDTADVLLRFAGGVTGCVHLDMVQRPAIRNCRLVGSEGVLTWDGLTHQVRLYSVSLGEWTDLHPANAFERNEMFRSELKHFLACVADGSKPRVTGEDGLRALEIALAVKASSRQGRFICLSEPGG